MTQPPRQSEGSQRADAQGADPAAACDDAKPARRQTQEGCDQEGCDQGGRDQGGRDQGNGNPRSGQGSPLRVLPARLQEALAASLGGAQPIDVAQPDVRRAWRRTLPVFLFAVVFCLVLAPLSAAALITGLSPASQDDANPVFSGWFLLTIAAPLAAAGLCMLAAPVLALRNARATVYALCADEVLEVVAQGRRAQVRRLRCADVQETAALMRSDGAGDLILRYGPRDDRGRRALFVLRGLRNPEAWQDLIEARMPTPGGQNADAG